MKRTHYLFCTLVLFFAACDPCIASEEDDFLERANKFYQAALFGNCRESETMVRYPVLMDGRGIRNYPELERRCSALRLSATVLAKNVGRDIKDLALKHYRSGWMKIEVLQGHPLLGTHAEPNSEVSLFLLEVTSNQDIDEKAPLTLVFRHEYGDEDDGWAIIMFEDYSLSDLLNRE